MFNFPRTWWETGRESVREVPGFLSASSVVHYTSFPLGEAVAFCLGLVSYLDFVWRKKTLEAVPLPKYPWARMGFNNHLSSVRYHIPIRSKSWFFSQFSTTLNRIKMLSIGRMVYKGIESLQVPAHKGKSEFSNNKNTSEFLIYILWWDALSEYFFGTIFAYHDYFCIKKILKYGKYVRFELSSPCLLCNTDSSAEYFTLGFVKSQ